MEATPAAFNDFYTLPAEAFASFRTKAELEAVVTGNRGTLDELISLARKEAKAVDIQERNGSEESKRYGAPLDRSAFLDRSTYPSTPSKCASSCTERRVGIALS